MSDVINVTNVNNEESSYPYLADFENDFVISSHFYFERVMPLLPKSLVTSLLQMSAVQGLTPEALLKDKQLSIENNLDFSSVELEFAAYLATLIMSAKLLNLDIFNAVVFATNRIINGDYNTNENNN